MSKFVDGPLGQWELDTIGAWVGLALALALFPLRLFVSQLYVQTIPVIIGLASGLYLVLKRRKYRSPNATQWRISSGTGHVLGMVVLVGLGSMVFVGTYTGGRTIPFFGVAAVVGTILVAQIFFIRHESLRPMFILAQLVAYAFIVRWIALATTPGLIGVDAWIHVPTYAASLRRTGELSAIAESHYYGVPLYHLLVVTAAEAFNTSLRTALYGTLGIVMPISIVFVYLSGRFFLTARWSLFAAAAFGVADHVVRWGIHIIPTSMGLVFFLGVFYGVSRISATRSTSATYLIVLLFAVATIFTHHISTFVLLVFFGAGALAQLYVRTIGRNVGAVNTESKAGTVNFLVLLLAVLPITLVTWSRTPRDDGSFLFGMLETARRSFGTAGLLDLSSAAETGSGAVTSMAVSIPLSVQILDLVGFSVLLFLTLVGSFTLLQRDHLNLISLSWVNAAGGMLLVVLGTPMFGLYFLVPGRWFAFAYVPMVLLAAFGSRYLEANVPIRQFVTILVLVALVFPGAMLVNDKATPDNPIADDYYQQYAYSESELVAAETIAAIHPAGESLQTDHPYFLYFENAKGLSAEPLALTENGTVAGDRVVHRAAQVEGGTKAAYGGRTVRVRLSPDEVCSPGMDVIYTNGDVRYCRGSP